MACTRMCRVCLGTWKVCAGYVADIAIVDLFLPDFSKIPNKLLPFGIPETQLGHGRDMSDIRFA
jgi:hypothetical protein